MTDRPIPVPAAGYRRRCSRDCGSPCGSFRRPECTWRTPPAPHSTSGLKTNAGRAEKPSRHDEGGETRVPRDCGGSRSESRSPEQFNELQFPKTPALLLFLIGLVPQARHMRLRGAAVRIAPCGPVAQLVRAGDSSKRCVRVARREMNGMNSGKPSRMQSAGNPEPSRKCTSGRCRDYLRAVSALDNRLELPAPHPGR
jgi:hypothetical protein